MEILEVKLHLKSGSKLELGSSSSRTLRLKLITFFSGNFVDACIPDMADISLICLFLEGLRSG